MALPCTHLRPASMTSHFEESIMMGTREMSGSEAIRFKNRVMAALESSMASSMLMSITWAPFSTCWRATSTAFSKSPFRIRRANCLEPVTLVRSPTFTNKELSPMFKGSSPESRVAEFSLKAKGRGRKALTAWAMARIWSGVVPQQPPTTLTHPLEAKSFKKPEVMGGVSSKPVSAMGLGRPALG